MAIAFGGLFLAGEPAMNQLAFFFVTSVLVDTFLTRTILVPCMMDVLVSCHLGCILLKMPASVADRGG